MEESLQTIQTVPYGAIYKITNLLNKKIYVGQTTLYPPEKRLKGHYKKCKEKKHISNISLYNALRKYGIHNFKFEVLCNVDNRDELNEKEKEYIKNLNSMNRRIGYNLQSGGQEGSYMKKTKKILSRPTRKYLDMDTLEKFILENPSFSALTDSHLLGMAEATLGKLVKKHYGHSIIKLKSKLFNITEKEAEYTRKPISMLLFLDYVRKGYNNEKISTFMGLDSSCLVKRWKEYFPKYTFKYIQENTDKVEKEYMESNGKNYESYIYRISYPYEI